MGGEKLVKAVFLEEVREGQKLSWERRNRISEVGKAWWKQG